MSLYQPPVEHPHLSPTDTGLLQAVAAGAARLTVEQALELLKGAALPTLGRWADARCRTLHGDRLRTFIIDRNINYTNVCNAKCTFCAFRRDAGDQDAYTLSYESLLEKVAELEAIGGTQILMQGGMNPDLPLDWYFNLLAEIKTRHPKIHVHGFSPPEFVEFVHFFNPPGRTFEDKVRWVMVRLRDAGLDSLPGGGGEIFAEPVRRKIGLGKCDAEAWLTVMYVAHSLGMHTSATMMFGHIEGHADRIHHMKLVREWQDRALRDFGGGIAPEAWEPEEAFVDGVSNDAGAESSKPRIQSGAAGLSAAGDRSEASRTQPRRQAEGLSQAQRPHWPMGTIAEARRKKRPTAGGHYKAFIAWPFQRENTPLGRVKDWGAMPGELDAEFPGDVVARAFDWGKNPEVDYRTLGPAAAEFGRRVRMSGASEYLRTQAVSRLFLDNIYSIGSSWVTMGPHVGQVALMYGANDMGSVMMEENVVSSAGTTYCLDEAVLCRLVRESGFIPAQRDNVYDILKVHDGADAPDLRVADWSQHRARKMHQEAPKQPKVAISVSAGKTT